MSAPWSRATYSCASSTGCRTCRSGSCSARGCDAELRRHRRSSLSDICLRRGDITLGAPIIGRKQIMRKFIVATIAVAGLLPTALWAEVVRFDIIERVPAFAGRSFGDVGTYERITARAT